MSNPKDPQKPSGPVKINDFSVQVDRDLCIGAATCVAIAPEVFVLDSEAKAIIIDTADTATGEMLIDAARSCPTSAISVYDKDGKKLFPS